MQITNLDEFRDYGDLLQRLEKWLEPNEQIKGIGAAPIKPRFKRGKAYVSNMKFRVTTDTGRVKTFDVTFEEPIVYPVLAP